MREAELLVDAFGRIREAVHEVADGLTAGDLAYRPDQEANSIAWLLWHLTRVQDDHLADAMGHEQVWTSDGWAERFALPFAAEATGYGQSAEEVGRLRVESPDLLVGYHDAVQARTVADLDGLDGADLDRVVDTRWDPPVTLGVRLVSVVADGLQHAGQAGYLRGLVVRSNH